MGGGGVHSSCNVKARPFPENVEEPPVLYRDIVKQVREHPTFWLSGWMLFNIFLEIGELLPVYLS